MIDTLDIVSILLGAVVTYVALGRIGFLARDGQRWEVLAMGVGSTLLLAYAFSEGFHALQTVI